MRWASLFGGTLAASTAERTTTLAVGECGPNAQLDEHGTAVRLFDLYRGPHFTSLAYGPNAAHDLNLVRWPCTGAALRRVAVSAHDNESEHIERTLQDASGSSFRKNCGLDSDTILLVRPDGYIASIATRDMLATITLAAASLTPPTTDV